MKINNDVFPIIENTIFIEKENLLQNLLNKINYFTELNINKLINNKELLFSYIIYSKFNISKKKINILLNSYLQQQQKNFELYINYDILSSCNGPMQTMNGIQIIDVEKIKIKIKIKILDKF